VGTADNSPYLCIPAAIAYRRDVLGGEDAIRTYCFDLAKRAGETVSCILGTEVLENNEGTLGQCCFANVRLPIDAAQILQIANRHVAAVQDVEAMRVQVRNWISMTLIEDHGMFIATMWYGDAWWARLSSQVYLQIEDFEKAAHVLQLVCDRVESGEVFAEVAKL
jgi:selenocysteine lyase/cysteine desulfurase